MIEIVGYYLIQEMMQVFALKIQNPQFCIMGRHLLSVIYTGSVGLQEYEV